MSPASAARTQASRREKASEQAAASPAATASPHADHDEEHHHHVHQAEADVADGPRAERGCRRRRPASHDRPARPPLRRRPRERRSRPTCAQRRRRAVEASLRREQRPPVPGTPQQRLGVRGTSSSREQLGTRPAPVPRPASASASTVAGRGRRGASQEGVAAPAGPSCIAETSVGRTAEQWKQARNAQATSSAAPAPGARQHRSSERFFQGSALASCRGLRHSSAPQQSARGTRSGAAGRRKAPRSSISMVSDGVERAVGDVEVRGRARSTSSARLQARSRSPAHGV